MCFTFDIPADIDHNDVDAAELWVYRQSDPHANEAQSFLVSEIESWDSKKINKPLAIHYANSSGMNNSALTLLKIDIYWLSGKSDEGRKKRSIDRMHNIIWIHLLQIRSDTNVWLNVFY